MTTTLRPAEPLQQHADGTRARRYQVCVNSRPVGEIHLATVIGTTVARITDLRIEEPDRRRGRATVAALAAEEVARGWGCIRIETVIPAGAEPALNLARALGYTPSARAMVKRLGDVPPELPEGSRARPMTEAEFESWLAKGRESYARSLMSLGLSEEEARAKSRRDHETRLGEGLATEGVRFSVLEHEGTPVGTIWLARADDTPWVLDVGTDEAHRGRGHGRSLMLHAEAQTIADGERTLTLNVRAGNTPAERLYASLGYETTRHVLAKPLL
ncbi:GNAT family N-acetyltransferase [Streptomyces sp. SID4985]|uniref:GNAT family N-acetyltransferase n=1 Tax=Streptomyces sp. SID4985 TaxID=2690292 RepID=UPI001368088F|nr:GNAT family N-acetyltransferase [Streptomyces sp. SID4985]MYQ43570.1 GNAT family N-acetyltransferase [Streptomyces sp. SID4985]